MKRILIASNGEKVFMIEKENQTLINIGKTINSTRTVELENEIKKRIGTKSNAFLSIYNFLGFFCYYLAFAFSKDKTKNKSYNRTSKEYLP